jgi:glutamine synthetase
MGPDLAKSYVAVRQNEWDNLKDLSLEEEVALLAERY